MNLIESVPNPMSNSNNFLAAGVVTMSSLELVDFINNQRADGEAELRHADFLAKVPNVLGAGERNFSSTYRDVQNKVRPCYRFPKREACLMAMSYSYDLQAKVFDRMTELEAKVAKPVQTELSRMDILQIAMQAEQERLVAIEQRDEAIRTKAEIGSRREATAMATAAKAKREAYMLKEQLGFNSNHATVITVEKALKRKFPTNAYVGLRKWCKANGATAKDVTDPRYGKVKAWPAAAWLEVYGVDLVEVNGGAA